MISYHDGLVGVVSIMPVTMLFGICSANHPRDGLGPGCVYLVVMDRVGMDCDRAFLAADRGAH